MEFRVTNDVGRGASVIGGIADVNTNLFDVFLVANFPFALIQSFTVHEPELLVMIFPLLRVQEPETDQDFEPVEFVEAIDEVLYLEDGSRVETFHFTAGLTAAPTRGIATDEISRHDEIAITGKRLNFMVETFEEMK
jgi:hypothetical protein